MRLLVYTQTVDSQSPTLGFFHRWVEALAARVEVVHVVCLYEGAHALPHNVSVHSLGKERGRSRVGYVRNFFRLLLKLHGSYDCVFVHMNQEYILLGGWWWKLCGIPVSLWRNHYAGSFLTRVAGALCAHVFYTSRASYTASFPRAVQMPIGVDLALFSPSQAPIPKTILMLGRVAPSKRVDVFVEALCLLAARGETYAARVCGPIDAQDAAYEERMRARAHTCGLDGMLVWEKGVPHAQTLHVYRGAHVLVNLSEAGMYDKTMFEAAASGCVVVSANRESPFMHAEPTPEACAEAIRRAWRMPHASHVSCATMQGLEVLMDKVVHTLAV